MCSILLLFVSWAFKKLSVSDNRFTEEKINWNYLNNIIYVLHCLFKNALMEGFPNLSEQNSLILPNPACSKYLTPHTGKFKK